MIINIQNVLNCKWDRGYGEANSWKGAPLPTTMDRLHGATWLPMGADKGSSDNTLLI